MAAGCDLCLRTGRFCRPPRPSDQHQAHSFVSEAFTLPTLAADEGESHITLKARHETVTVNRGQTLLDSLEQQDNLWNRVAAEVSA